MSIQTLTRRFKFGVTVLNDPDPSLSPEQVIALYSTNYPFMRNASLSAPVVEGDTLVYVVEKPAATTKGAADPITQALASLDAWEAKPEQADRSIASTGKLLEFLRTVDKAPANPIRDAMLIPLA